MSAKEDYAAHFVNWMCPRCGLKPEGMNYPIKLIDTTHGGSLVEWVHQGGRPGFCLDVSERPVSSVDEMLGHITVFEGCFKCFDKEMGSNPIGAHLFKMALRQYYQMYKTIPVNSDGWIFVKL